MKYTCRLRTADFSGVIIEFPARLVDEGIFEVVYDHHPPIGGVVMLGDRVVENAAP